MSNQLSNVGAGTYTVTVTDANGCSETSTVIITEPSAVNGSIMDNGDGTATANVNGGTGPYTYQWDPATGNQTTATATGLANGIYYVVITDATGCTDVVTIQTTVVGLEHISAVGTLNLYPNPTNSTVFVELNLVEQQDVYVQINTVTGQTVFSKIIGQTLSGTIELETATLPTGVYLVQFNIGEEQLTKKLIIAK